MVLEADKITYLNPSGTTTYCKSTRLQHDIHLHLILCVYFIHLHSIYVCFYTFTYDFCVFLYIYIWFLCISIHLHLIFCVFFIHLHLMFCVFFLNIYIWFFFVLSFCFWVSEWLLFNVKSAYYFSYIMEKRS
jgi:hypothetical protein